MKEKINYSECMKRKCQDCKHYDDCFGYKPKINKKGNDSYVSKSDKQI